MSTTQPPTDPGPVEPMEQFDMRADFEGLIQLLARNLYPEPDVFIRELIQNGADSIRLRREIEPGHVGRIEIEISPTDSTITFRDNGLGMSREDIRNFLSVIGATGTGTARRRLEEGDGRAAFELIGQFGIGMLSAFVVADCVTVRTRKLGETDAWEWQNEGKTECRLQQTVRERPGTDIVVNVGRSHGYMLKRARIKDAIIRYCDFLPVPIHVDGGGPVNLVHAPWDHVGWQSVSARENAYRHFVAHRFTDTPLEVIPIEIEEPVRARGALYISDRRLPDLNTAGVVDIFVRRMFVRGADAELLPGWAKFVRGVIECPDLQPTAARDNIRRDHWAYTTLQQRLGELIVDRITELATELPERFREINRWHHYHLKGMALFHDDFFDRVAGLLLYETNRGLLPLNEIFAGTDAVHYFSALGAEPQFYRLADARDWLVVNAGHLFEKELLEKYARATETSGRLVAIDSTDDRVLFDMPRALTEQACRNFEAHAERTLAEIGLEGVTVQVRNFPPESLPAVILLTPQSEAELRLEALAQQAWFLDSLGSITRDALQQRGRRPLRLRLNERSSLVRSIVAAPPSPETLRSVLAGLHLSAAINAKDVINETTVEIHHRELVRLLERSAAEDS